MRARQLFWVEIARVFRSRPVWLVMGLTVAGLASGFYTRSGTTMASLYLAEQVKSATLLGTVLFALLTLYELSRVRRSSTDAITDSIASPTLLAAVRLFAVQCAALAASVLAMLVYLPYAAWKLGVVFSLGDYATCFLLILFPALFFGCLIAAACYQVTCRIDVSALAVLAFLFLSRSGLRAENYLWQWSLPHFPALSDDFSNAQIFRTAAYVRLVWLALLSGVWLLSLLCVRRYGKGLLGSLAHGLRRFWMPVMAIGLLTGGVLLWQGQPFYDHSPVDWMSVEDEDHAVEGVRLVRTDADTRVASERLGTLEGVAVYELENTTGKEQPFYLSLNSGYGVRRITANGAEIPFEDLRDDYIARRHLRFALSADRETILRVEYGGMPKMWNAMQEMLGGGDLISRSYIQLNGKNLTPVPDVAMSDETTPFVLRITMRTGMTPVASGYTPKLLRENADGTSTWQAEDAGVSAMTLFAGDYVKVDLEGGEIPIEFYYSRKHQRQLTEIDAVRIMEETVRYCTEHYGPRAFSEDQPFKIIQGTELLFGGFAKYNISVISEESFTVENLADTAKGAAGAEVLAHEIVHQWWGLGAMLSDPEDFYWSSEGITTYTTYRLMKELKGEAYAKQHYYDVWEQAVADNRNNFYIRNPEYLSVLPETYAANIQAETRSVNWYSGYALMFAQAAELLGGEEPLDAVLATLYREGGSEMPPEITRNDFLNACGLTKEDLNLA